MRLYPCPPFLVIPRLTDPDIYRRQARNLAWYDQEGEPSTHNPFKKFRAKPRRSSSIHLETRLPHVRTAGELRSSEERARRRDMTEGLQGPQHADTFADSSYSGGANRPNTASDGLDRPEPEPSMRSQDPINVSFNDEDLDAGDRERTKPRKRRTLLGTADDDDDDLEAASNSTEVTTEPEKQKFTVAGQIKATVLNSWMNILIMAAPIGSEYLCMCQRESLTGVSCIELCQKCRSAGRVCGQLCRYYVWSINIPKTVDTD